MVEGALKRRRDWPSIEDAFGRFRKREFFSRCSDDVLWLYTRGITRPKTGGEGIELAYPPEWEAQIFATSPYDEWAYPRRITRPCAIIAGQHSDIFTAPSQRAWQRLRPDIPITCLPDAGHLLPLERPQALAHAIRDFVATLPS
jgi:pimeloyl-ACP methyl ester carboxylesterase